MTWVYAEKKQHSKSFHFSTSLAFSLKQWAYFKNSLKPWVGQFCGTALLKFTYIQRKITNRLCSDNRNERPG